MRGRRGPDRARRGAAWWPAVEPAGEGAPRVEDVEQQRRKGPHAANKAVQGESSCILL